MLHKGQTELFNEWLDNYLNFEKIKNKDGFSLETMRFLVNRFKHPEADFRSIHVAGSKGKGSVSTMLAHILEAGGKSTGLYTSPHILDFTERVGTPAGPFDDALYGRACDQIVPLVESIIPENLPNGAEPSWFELITLFAFVTFREAGLEWAVIETGLGGRLDATNVIVPEACVITPIELEHTEYLGDTITKIAGEKAGIIKPGIPTFLSPQKAEARDVFRQTAERLHAPLFSMEDAVKSVSATPNPDGLDIQIAFNDLTGGARFSRPLATRLRLVNRIQAQNAALAAYTAKYLFPELQESVIERGLAAAWLPGRFEICGKTNPVILDGAHTVQSVTLTVETFRELFPARAHLLFACAADKNVDEMARLFTTGFDRVTVTRPGDRKASDMERASRAFTEVFAARADVAVRVEDDYRSAIQNALTDARAAGVPLLVTGSFYLVAEAKKILADQCLDR